MGSNPHIIQRRAVSEVVSSIVLIAVIAAASFLATGTSTKQTIGNERTVSEALQQKGMQIQELVSVIDCKTNPDKIILEMVNYGVKTITIDRVLVDGAESGFAIKHKGLTLQNNTIPKKAIFVLETNMTGGSVQLITGTGNLINIKAW